jgi:hypothetical protein
MRRKIVSGSGEGMNEGEALVVGFRLIAWFGWIFGVYEVIFVIWGAGFRVLSCVVLLCLLLCWLLVFGLLGWVFCERPSCGLRGQVVD